MYEMSTNELISTLLDRVVEASADRGRSDQRQIETDNKFFAANDEIRALKTRLAKYEPVPGYPIPFSNVEHQLTSDEKIKLVRSIVSNHIAGAKINAIKDIRSLTGAGLKEAKDCYEAAFAVELPIKGDANVSSMENLLRLVHNEPESKIAIIKEVRSICGIGLKEAKDAVEFALTGTWDSNYLGGGKYKTINSRW